jgi:DNA-binding Lrp family transcriptional regulator
MAEEGTDYDYTGLHAFVFIDQVDPGTNIRTVIDVLRGFGPPPDGPVMFASEMVGSSLGFAHIRVEDGDLSGLQDLIAGGLWERGVHCRYCIEVDYAHNEAVRKAVKRSTPEIIAIVRMLIERGQLSDVLGELLDPHGPVADTFKGASVVTGDTDMLVQLGAEDFQTVADAVYGPLQSIGGITNTDTAFTDARRY